jgi:catechol 2,3-dioxygenase-like lactoylglutathione lyase family enzyme
MLSGAESAEIGKAMGFDVPTRSRAYLLAFGEGSKTSPSTLVDLLQWTKPSVKGEPYDSLNNVGIARLCFAVDDIDKTYEDLRSKGVQFINPPQNIELRPGAKDSLPHRVCCFKDPDGIILELAAPLKQSKTGIKTKGG